MFAEEHIPTAYISHKARSDWMDEKMLQSFKELALEVYKISESELAKSVGVVKDYVIYKLTASSSKN